MPTIELSKPLPVFNGEQYPCKYWFKNSHRGTSQIQLFLVIPKFSEREGLSLTRRNSFQSRERITLEVQPVYFILIVNGEHLYRDLIGKSH